MITDDDITPEMLAAYDLKPCPFCGGQDLAMRNTHTASYWIACETCGAEVHGYSCTPRSGIYKTKKIERQKHNLARQSAAAAWNSRA